MLTALTLLALLSQESSAPRPEVEARLPASYVAVSLRLEHYVEDEERALQAARELGDKAVLFGGFGREGGRISIEAEREGDEPHASAWWRERLAGDEGLAFDVGAVACLERSVALEGAQRLEFRAFPVAAGYCFDVRVSLPADGSPPAFGRADFVAIVESFRVAFLRRGFRADYPEHVLDVMHAAAVRGPQGAKWLELEEERDPADYALPFVRGELLKVQGAPHAAVVAAFERALPRFAALEAPSAREIFAWAVAEDGLGLGLANSGRPEAALAHYRHGYALAERIRHPVRAALAYNLACACALAGEREEALACLRRAIEVNERYRKVARTDADLASLRESAEFARIVGTDDGG